jgi:hypothetical protein
MTRDNEILEPDPRILIADDLQLRIENDLWTVWLVQGRQTKRLIDIGFPTCIEAEKFAQGYELGRRQTQRELGSDGSVRGHM